MDRFIVIELLGYCLKGNKTVGQDLLGENADADSAHDFHRKLVNEFLGSE